MFRNIIGTKEIKEKYGIKQSIASSFMSGFPGAEKIGTTFIVPRGAFVSFINDLKKLMTDYNIDLKKIK